VGNITSLLRLTSINRSGQPYTPTMVNILTAAGAKVFSTGILKISVVTDKREYRIYRNFIGDRNKISEEI
jgi:hypothetical protein